ncbi:MAG: SDR family oxidoreductase [Rhodocyclaceae bacterium]|jgi:NAD(P)-dependent dehydrogenase (short-subunit alcohol dehydrogenase family)|nr:SDR family oxidoreductase [Rhodocyclaceae bacterium]
MSSPPLRHAVVTGASRGIGAAIAFALEAQGLRVTRLARNARDGIIACDVTDAAAVSETFAEIRRRHGAIDILINNAGRAVTAPFATASVDSLRQMLDVNLIGAWQCTQTALPDMQATGWGRIVNIASTAGLTGYAYTAAYCAAKHALVGFTRALARELARSEITVNALCPGFTDTDMVAGAAAQLADRSGRSLQQARQSLAAFNPQQRFVRSEEVAAAAVWLCQPEAAAVTGQAISISGGEILT